MPVQRAGRIRFSISGEKNMRELPWVFAVCCLLLAGCAKPLPPEKVAYAGEWRSTTMSLLITTGGNVNYKRVDGNTSKSVNGPLQAFEGDNFVVGVGPVKTTFVVSMPPYQDQGTWKMTVDGVELTRVPVGE
jgi:hypothetical protein